MILTVNLLTHMLQKGLQTNQDNKCEQDNF